MTKKNSNFKLVWLKLVRNATQDARHQTPGQPDDASADSDAAETANPNDVTLLSLNKRTITPDKRFKIHHQPPSKWTLTIDNVGPADDKAYYLCQMGGGQSVGGGNSMTAADSDGSNGLSFVGGARLNVLVPPKIVENDTSPNLVQVDEYNQLRLQCKVISEPQSQIWWRREDGKSLDGLEQRFRHHIDRRPHQVVSIDSGELLFSAIRREQAGAYLCIASNGVRPGVSQRISVAVGNCRHSSEPNAKLEPCDQPESNDGDNDDSDSNTAEAPTSTSTTRRPAPLQPPPPPPPPPPRQSSGWSPKRSNWTSNGRTGAEGGEPPRRVAQQPAAHRVAAPGNQTDKSRSSRYNQSRRAGQSNQQRRPPATEPGSSGARATVSFQYSISATLAAVTVLVWRSHGPNFWLAVH